jgi:hypothetical protein
VCVLVYWGGGERAHSGNKEAVLLA